MIELNDVTYTYPGADAPAVCGCSISLAPGGHLAFIGLNGSGKSTLARLANGALAAQSGSVRVDGVDASEGADARREVARLVGMVRQDPVDQFVASRVFEEVAFGPCNLGLSPEEVARRVSGALERCGLGGMEGRTVTSLSGGMAQRLAVADALAMHPSYLAMDEATAFLDPGARYDLRRLVDSLVASGCGVLTVSHELEDVLAADRVALVEAGRLTWQGRPDELMRDDDVLRRAGLENDPLARAMRARSRRSEIGWQDGGWTDSGLKSCAAAADHGSPNAAAGSTAPSSNAAGLRLRGTSVAYGEHVALDRVSLDTPAGSVTLIAGCSGAGKTTAVRLLAGVLEPDSGEALLDGSPVRPGTVGLSFQQAESQLFCATVAEELAFGPQNLGCSPDEVSRRVASALAALGIEGLAEHSPLSLSGGQARRVAIASVLAMEPAAYVFDEPTAGLDGVATQELVALVRGLADAGAGVAVVRHDIPTWIEAADRAVLLRDGAVSWQGPASDLAAKREPYKCAGMRVPRSVELLLERGFA